MNVYTNNTELQTNANIKGLFVTSNWYCFDDRTGYGDYDLTHVSNDAIDRAAKKLVNLDMPILLDIECFDIVSDYDNSIFNFQNALRRWKSANPKRLIGLYSQLPVRNYWASVSLHIYRSEDWNSSKLQLQRKKYKTWQDTNDKVANDLINFVDFICPSLYAFTPTEDRHWTIYADANLSESVRISSGKPVWPIIWPKYQQNVDMSLSMWSKVLEFVSTFPNINNIIAYAPDSVTFVKDWQLPLLSLINN